MGIGFQQLPVAQAEPLQSEFNAFLDAAETRRPPQIDGRTARKTLELALAVLAKIEAHAGVVEKTLASGWKP